MGFENIRCQDKAIEILQRAYRADRVAHAYIFAGLDGVGKALTAREYAKLLLCEAPGENDGRCEGCGKCESCRLVEAGAHPDYTPIYKELKQYTEKGKNKAAPIDLPIDVIREFLIDKVSNRPTLSSRRVFIVSEAERLNKSSQNALLKVLEEPPAYCCIILLCTRLDRLLPTTRSRCQIVRFGPVDTAIIVEKLRNMGLGADHAAYLAGLSQGSIGQACKWAELEQAEKPAEIFALKKRIVKSLAALQYPMCIDMAEKWVGAAKDLAKAWAESEQNTSSSDIKRRADKLIITMAVSALQDAMKTDIGALQQPVNQDQTSEIETLRRKYGAETLAKKIAGCYQSLRWVEASVNEKLIFEQLLLNLA